MNVVKVSGTELLRSFFPWLAVLLILLAIALVDSGYAVRNCVYQGARFAGTVIIIWQTVRALVLIYRHIDDPNWVWYGEAFLLSTVAFWALFPPAWFFLEYTLFEHGRIALFNGETCMPHCPSDICKEELTRLETYASLASKIWAGVGAVIAGTIALSQGKDKTSFIKEGAKPTPPNDPDLQD